MENTNQSAEPAPLKTKAKNSTYYRNKRIRKEKTKRAIRKYALILVLLLITPASVIGYFSLQLTQEQNAVQRAIVEDTARLDALRGQNEAMQEDQETMQTYAGDLANLGTMGEAIRKASEEFGQNADEAVQLQGLMLGIAKAESSLGKNYANAYDVNCHNWWGLKGGNMTKRGDGSSLRCFINDEAGARTMAKTLKLYYLNEGKDTPEKIVVKYVGSKWGIYHDQWVANVKTYVE